MENTIKCKILYYMILNFYERTSYYKDLSNIGKSLSTYVGLCATFYHAFDIVNISNKNKSILEFSTIEDIMLNCIPELHKYKYKYDSEGTEAFWIKDLKYDGSFKRFNICYSAFLEVYKKLTIINKIKYLYLYMNIHLMKIKIKN